MVKRYKKLTKIKNFKTSTLDQYLTVKLAIVNYFLKRTEQFLLDH